MGCSGGLPVPRIDRAVPGYGVVVSVNRAVLGAPAEAVFAVLADAQCYDRFVVGTKRIRMSDTAWPAEGTELHHTIGAGPFVLRDSTRVVEVRPPERLVLRAGMRPVGVSVVVFDLRPVDGGTEVRVEERPVEGPEAAVWNPLFDALLWLRNVLMLHRLDRLVQQRSSAPSVRPLRPAGGPAGPGGSGARRRR